MKLNILDKGFVRLIDFMGGDISVIRAARVSYGTGTKTPEEDKKLIKYLLEHKHGSPFEHTAFQFHIKMPMFVMRQFIRHRIGCSTNEISFRYTEVKEEFYEPFEWRMQNVKNKQGSTSEVRTVFPDGTDIQKTIREHDQNSIKLYRILLDSGIAREMARIVLPVNLYTEFYWTTNARALMHFLDLRLDSHAQYEIREYAKALKQIFKEKMPWTVEACEVLARVI